MRKIKEEMMSKRVIELIILNLRNKMTTKVKMRRNTNLKMEKNQKGVKVVIKIQREREENLIRNQMKRKMTNSKKRNRIFVKY